MSLRGGPQGRRGPDINRRVCRTHVPYAFGCNPFPHALALPLGELSPKVTERACRGGRPCPPKPAGLTRPAEGSGPYEMSTDRTLVGRGPCLPTVVPAGCWPLSRPTAGALPRNRLASSATGGASAIPAHRRASRLAGIVMPASRGTSSKSPRFIRHRRRFGDFPQISPARAKREGGQMACPPSSEEKNGKKKAILQQHGQ